MRLTALTPGGGGNSSGGAGFGPHPTGCLNGTDHKGYSLGEVSSCRNYEKLEHTEDELAGLAWQVCVGGGVSVFGATIEVNACYVNTPGGEGLAVSGGVSPIGAGFGANIHAGAGGSNAQTPSEYGGPFWNAGGSVEFGLGGYASAFAGKGESGNVVVAGGTAGLAVGVGAEVGTGPSYTEVIQF